MQYMTDERPKPSKAPKPIEPVRGTGYTMRACNQPANWDEWAYRVSAALWEAVALAHDFEPSTLPVDWRPADYSHPFADCPAEVALHIRIACDHAENGKLKCIASA